MARQTEILIPRETSFEPTVYLPSEPKVVIYSGHKAPGKVEFLPYLDRGIEIQALPSWFDEELMQDHFFGKVSPEFGKTGFMETDIATAIQLTESMARIKALACILDAFQQPGADPMEVTRKLQGSMLIETRDMMRWARIQGSRGLFMGKARAREYADIMVHTQFNHQTHTYQGVAVARLGLDSLPLLVSAIEVLQTPKQSEIRPVYTRNTSEQITDEQLGTGMNVCGVTILSNTSNPVTKNGTFTIAERRHFRGHIENTTTKLLKGKMAALSRTRMGRGLWVHMETMQEILDVHERERVI